MARTITGPEPESSSPQASQYPNPFCDMASVYIPDNLSEIFELCELVWVTFGTYSKAASRVVSYFLTDVLITDADDSIREDYENFLEKDLRIMQVLFDLGCAFMCYGNVFASLYFPFTRWLVCPHCGTSYNSRLPEIKYDFKLSELKFSGTCLKCKSEVVYRVDDRRSLERERVAVVFWDPKRIEIKVHPHSKREEYYYRVDAEEVRKLESGDRFFIEDTPYSVLRACQQQAKTGKQALYRFKSDFVFNLKDSILPGLPIKGWAIPPVLPNFRLAYYIMMLRRMDEAIAHERIMPFSVLSPPQPGHPEDTLGTHNMAGFVSAMRNMIRLKRKEMTTIQISPYPVNYQSFGGDAKNLAPKEQLHEAMDELLGAIGLPPELYRGSLQLQAFPVALRLFEKSWINLVDGFNQFLEWLTPRLNRYFDWGEVGASLRPVTLADDIELKALYLNGAAAMDLSKGTAYRTFKIDYLDEQRRVVEEQEEIQKLQQEAMERQELTQDQEQQGGGGQPGATPGDIREQAAQLAHTLLVETPENLRRGELIKIKQNNPTLHALVIQAMDEQRQEYSRQGQAMLMADAKQAESIPSPFALGLLISDALLGITRQDMRKIAADLNRGLKPAGDALRFVLRKQRS